MWNDTGTFQRMKRRFDVMRMVDTCGRGTGYIVCQSILQFGMDFFAEFVVYTIDFKISFFFSGVYIIIRDVFRRACTFKYI